MLEVSLLGQFELVRDGERLAVPTRNAQSLFAFLVLNPGIPQRRERLAAMLWPDSAEENARSNLRHELWRLRKVLEAPNSSFLLIDDLSISFNSHAPFSLDVLSLERSPSNPSSPDDLFMPLSLYRGELLPGFYDEWVFPERQRIQSIFEARFSTLLDLLIGQARWSDTIDWANRWIAFGGWPEPAFRALITALASSGNSSKAVATYEHYAQALQRDPRRQAFRANPGYLQAP